MRHVLSTFISDTAMPGPTQLCFQLPPQTAIHLSDVMEETLEGKEQDQGILRFGGQVWRRGKGGLPRLNECPLRLGACLELSVSEG